MRFPVDRLSHGLVWATLPCALITTSAAAQISAQQTTPGDPQFQAIPVSFLDQFLELPPNLSKRTFFELRTEAGDIGFSDVILRSKEDGKNGTVYSYENSMAFRTDSGTRVEAKVEADLSTRFRPSRVVTTQTVTSPTGEVRSNTIKTSFTKTQMVIDNPRNEDYPHRVIELPEGTPLIAGLDAAVELARFDRQPNFMIAEINAQLGKLDPYMGEVSVHADGSQTVLIKQVRGEPAYRIKLDAEGKLQRWDSLLAKFTIKRCDKDEFEAVKAKVYE